LAKPIESKVVASAVVKRSNSHQVMVRPLSALMMAGASGLALAHFATT